MLHLRCGKYMRADQMDSTSTSLQACHAACLR